MSSQYLREFHILFLLSPSDGFWGCVNLPPLFCHCGTGKISQISRLYLVLRDTTLILNCLSPIENGKQILLEKWMNIHLSFSKNMITFGLFIFILSSTSTHVISTTFLKYNYPQCEVFQTYKHSHKYGNHGLVTFHISLLDVCFRRLKKMICLVKRLLVLKMFSYFSTETTVMICLLSSAHQGHELIAYLLWNNVYYRMHNYTLTPLEALVITQ